MGYNVCLSVCPSVRPSAQNNSAPSGKDFDKTLYLNIFRKYVEKIQVFFKDCKNNGHFI